MSETLVREFRLRVKAFDPESFPMARIADYLAALAAFAPEGSVFQAVEKKESTDIIHFIPEALAQPYIDGLLAGQVLESSEFKRLDGVFAKDATSGDYLDANGLTLLRFHGEQEEREETLIRRRGTIDGIPILIGGKRDIKVELLLLDSRVSVRCDATLRVAHELGELLHEQAIRATGIGVWAKSESGLRIKTFDIESYRRLKTESISESLRRLRSIASGFWAIEDPLGELDKVRHGK